MKDDTEPQKVPCGACGSWVLLDILGEPTAEPTKIYGLNDILEKGKHKGKTVAEVILNDWNWIKWASMESQQFFFDIDKVIDERKKSIKVLQPDDLMPFGKYRGQTVQSIADKDYSYLLWVKENSEDVVIDFGKLNRK